MQNRLRVPLAATGRCCRNSSGIMQEGKTHTSEFQMVNNFGQSCDCAQKFTSPKFIRNLLKIYYYTNRLSNILKLGQS